MPITATGPESGVSTPSLIVVPSKPGTFSSDAASPESPESPSSSAAPPQPASRSASSATSHRTLFMLSPSSVGERPCLEVGLQTEPHGGQPTRLEHQEQDDQQAEDGLVEGEHRDEAVVGRRGGHARDRVRVVLDHGREAAEEQRAEHGAEDRPDAADDDDRDVLDREEQRPLVRGDVLLVGAVERAAERREAARYREGGDLVAAELDTDDLGRDVAVADRLDRPARPRADDVLGEQRAQADEPPHQPEPPLVADVLVAEDRDRVEVERAERRLGGDRRARVAAREPFHVSEQMLAEEDEA